MSSPIITDSSAFVSLASVSDKNHQLALKVSEDLIKTNRPAIVPGEIFTETVNVLSKKINHKTAIEAGEKIFASEAFIVIETSPAIRSDALEKFKSQPESVSFTDCLVMAFADAFHTQDIFGFDQVFRKNGYKRLGVDKSSSKITKK